MDEEPAPIENPTPYLALNSVLMFGLFATALATGWWAAIRGPDLLLRPDNLRRVIEERYVTRGRILDRSNLPITVTVGDIGTFHRNYIYPDLAPIVGYNEPTYGQAGLEAAFDGYLRGQEGNPALTIWWNHLLYGMTPDGLDVRLSIDLYLQTRADEMMKEHLGAIVLLNAQTGEVMVMSSHPTFNANQLTETAADLLLDPQTPLINRAALGVYPTDSVMEPFAMTLFNTTNLDQGQWQDVYETFGFLRTPDLRLEAAPSTSNDDDFYVSPLQMALASAVLSNAGVIPAPRIAVAVNTPNDGWVVLPAEGKPVVALQASATSEAVLSYIQGDNNYWSHIELAQDEKSSLTWFIGGTRPNWMASPLTIVVLLEENNPREAEQIGVDLLVDAMTP